MTYRGRELRSTITDDGRLTLSLEEVTVALKKDWTPVEIPFRGAGVKLCASFSLRAQSSQHTSTVLPPIFTLMEFASSLQSQAAQVFSVMTPLSDECPHLRER